MTLRSVSPGSWRCTPVVAAFLVSRVVWAADADLLIDDLERMNALAKRLQVTVDEALILEVHCMLNGEHDTSVEFLAPTGLPAAQDRLALQLIASAAELALREHLVRRTLGFGRN